MDDTDVFCIRGNRTFLSAAQGFCAPKETGLTMTREDTIIVMQQCKKEVNGKFCIAVKTTDIICLPSCSAQSLRIPTVNRRRKIHTRSLDKLKDYILLKERHRI